MKRLNQAKVAQDLGISKSYLSMILSGQRKCPPGLIEKLQSTPGIHKVVNKQVWGRSYTQEVRGSSPLLPTIGNMELSCLLSCVLRFPCLITADPMTSISEEHDCAISVAVNICFH